MIEEEKKITSKPPNLKKATADNGSGIMSNNAEKLDTNLEIQRLRDELEKKYEYLPAETKKRIIDRFIDQKFTFHENAFKPISLTGVSTLKLFKPMISFDKIHYKSSASIK